MSPVLQKAIYRQLEIDEASYRTIELPEDRLKGFFSGFKVGGFDGVNVTIPHKAAVIPLLNEVDSRAKLINAVNCVHRVGNRLTGYNTDLLGFAYSMRRNEVDIEGQRFAILGAGGAAQAVGFTLAESNARSILLVNRSPERAEQLQQIIAQANQDVAVEVVDQSELLKNASNIDCVINSTPVGMYPDTRSSPIDRQFFGEHMVAFDLIYNPQQTQFLKAAAKAGAKTINGLQMLVAQAVYSVEIWMGGNILTHVDMNALLRDLQKNLK